MFYVCNVWMIMIPLSIPKPQRPNEGSNNKGERGGDVPLDPNVRPSLRVGHSCVAHVHVQTLDSRCAS